MSSIGTGIATSVASVAQTAQQTARARDKRSGDAQRTAQEVADRFEQRLHAAGEANDPDAELPDHQAPGYEQLYLQDGDGEPLSEPADPSAPVPVVYGPAAPPPSAPEHPLYQHLDIQA
ncbi:MAG: hypothetical protein AAF333_10265 [Planctomycetota bacterium]